MMDRASSNPGQLVAIGQYAVERELSPGRSFLARGPAGFVVIKLLDPECLVHGRLHPSIHDRLARVRELAHMGVANLHGVERDGPRVFAVWEFIPGRTLQEYSEQLDSPATLTRLAREAILAVESMHALGIVHGRVHQRNVIIDQTGQIHLTHVSPLLYDDPMVDAKDLCTMLQSIAKQRGWSDSQFMNLKPEPLSQMRARLSQGELISPPDAQAGNRQRWSSLAAAAVVIVLAAALVIALVHLAKSSAIQRPQPPPESVRPLPSESAD